MSNKFLEKWVYKYRKEQQGIILEQGKALTPELRRIEELEKQVKQIIVFIIGSLIAMGNLFQANHYQCTKQAILHPKVRQLLTWDGKDNPYSIQPITPEAKLAFEGKNWEVNVRWVCIILINASLFAWAVYAYNG